MINNGRERTPLEWFLPRPIYTTTEPRRQTQKPWLLLLPFWLPLENHSGLDSHHCPCYLHLLAYPSTQNVQGSYHGCQTPQFNFTNNNNNLQYKLDLNITLRNPNKKMAIYFDKIEANAFYEGQRFDTENLTIWGFKVERKSTHFLNATFAGQQWMELGANELDFNEEKSVGVYSIDLKCYLRIRFRIGDFIGGDHKPKVKCGLKVPLSSNGNLSTARFETTRCDVHLF